MQVLLFIIELVKIPAIILGLISMIGLIIQRKPFGEVLLGTVKTVLGLLIMSVGIGALINALIPIQNMFQAGFSATSLQTFVTFDEGVVGAIQSANVGEIGAAIAWTMLFGYVVHILL